MTGYTKEALNKKTVSKLAQLSDEELLAKYQSAEDSSVFSELVSRYERELYNYLRRYLGDGVLAEDVFQTTFLQVHLKCDSFEQGRKFRPWLYTIATNQAIDAQRRNRRHRRLSLDVAHSASGEEVGTLMEVVATQDAGPSDAVDTGEQAEWIRKEVATLPEALQSAVNLVYFRGMKYRDAAKIMSVPVGTVKSRLHAAIKRLGRSWRDLQVTIVNTQAQELRPLGRNITENCPSLFYAAFANLRKLYLGEPTPKHGRLALCYTTSQRYTYSPSRSILSPATYPHFRFRQGMGKCQDNRK